MRDRAGPPNARGGRENMVVLDVGDATDDQLEQMAEALADWFFPRRSDGRASGPGPG